MKDWTITSETKELTADFFDVYQQHLRGPNGIRRVYKVVRRRPTVCIVPLTDNQEIFIVGQDRPLLGKYSWELVAGFININEKPLEAAKRELAEETGIRAKKWDKIASIESSASVVRALFHAYIASDLTYGEINPDEGENLKVVKIPLNEAVEKVISGEIMTSASIAVILLLDTMIKRKKI